MAQGPRDIYIAPFTALEAIANLLNDADAASWLASARGNVETRILRGEIVLNSIARKEWETHLELQHEDRLEEEDAYRSVFDLVEIRDDGDAYLDQILEEAREEARRQLYGFSTGLAWDSDDSCDADRCLWKRWADSD